MDADVPESIAQFREIWPGGYFEGDPLDPLAHSSYGRFGYMSVLHAAYLVCIKPYVHSNTTVIEIGPGRGAWTATFIRQGARKIYALDAAPPEHTGFWDYVGHRPEVEYLTVDDCSMEGVPDESGDYFFSFGVFCHLAQDDVRLYLASLFKKLKRGAHGFLLIGDFDKYNRLCSEQNRYSVLRRLERIPQRRFLPLRWGYRAINFCSEPFVKLQPIDKNRSDNFCTPEGLGAWHHFPLDALCSHLSHTGFEVLDPDVGANPRDPIVHFLKP